MKTQSKQKLAKGRRPDPFGRRLRAARESAGFTQEALAEAVGVSRTAVARWESGDIEPKLQNLVLVAQTLHVSTDALLGLSTAQNEGLSSLSDEALFTLDRLIAVIRRSE